MNEDIRHKKSNLKRKTTFDYEAPEKLTNQLMIYKYLCNFPKSIPS